MKNIKTHSFLFVIVILFTFSTDSNCQTVTTTMSTQGLKYTLLEVAMATWGGYDPDADQYIIEKIQPMYPRSIIAFWHGYSGTGEPMMVAGDPYCTGTGYISGFPTGTIDRAIFGGTVGQNRPWASFVGTRDALAPNFDVKMISTYNTSTRIINVAVTGTALSTLSGDWNINAYITEDSVSSGSSSAYNQHSYYYPCGTLSTSGTLSWYVDLCQSACPSYGCATCAILPDSLYSHMHVVRAIISTSGSIWGDPSFSNPAIGTSVTKNYSYTVPPSSNPQFIKIIGLVQKFDVADTNDRPIENAVQLEILPSTLHFTHGHIQSLNVCQNSISDTINSLLTVYDSSIRRTVNWSVVSGVTHGTLLATYSTTSAGGILVPAGLTYTPITGYTGIDAFKIRVDNGITNDTTTINIVINPLLSFDTISGPSSVCIGRTITLTDGVPCGAWSSSATSIATVGSTGIVTGVSTGTATISYSGGSTCGSGMASHALSVNDCSLLTNHIGTKNEIKIYPNPTQNEIIITNINQITSVSITSLIGQTVFTNEYNTGKVLVDVSRLPAGIYLLRINGTEVRKFVKE